MDNVTDQRSSQTPGSATAPGSGPATGTADAGSPYAPPQITLPAGGGAIRGTDEKFKADQATGAGSFHVALPVSPGRSGFVPALSLDYDSGNGNGIFGLGWKLSLPSITRRTDKGLPRYHDHEESDIFVLSGWEDLVPVLRDDGDGRAAYEEFHQDGHQVRRYRPRIEGLFSRIERWSRTDTGETHWRSISRDNVLTLYGTDASSRIADPQAPDHVFSWLISRSYDDKGNAIFYEYAAEDARSADLRKPSERSRIRTANRYPSRIRYGNRMPLLRGAPTPDPRPQDDGPQGAESLRWMFEVVFDYGEERHGEDPPSEHGCSSPRADPQARSDWPAREDPFSSYRSGFEIRTHRLCRQVLMFHHFTVELGDQPYLVQSTAMDYREHPAGSVLARVRQSGHRRGDDGHYLTRSLPPVEFSYTTSPLTDPGFTGYRLEEASPQALADLPGGVDGELFRWLDLDGEGIAGVLTEQGDGWFYKHNLGAGRLGSARAVARRPSVAMPSGGHQQFLDVAGDGGLDLVDFSPPAPGFFERAPGAGWAGFRAFHSLPTRDFGDPNLRFVDLTGDGVADVLVTEDDVLTWHASLRWDGFGPAYRVPVPLEEDSGPRVVFADGTQSLYLADMSGDGLSDLLRIRNGEACYWPNRGYGRFGAKVTMDRSPWFDEPDLFDQQRIRLADTDGSGTTDILYLGRTGVRVFLNESGNGWSDARDLRCFPAVDNLSAVSVGDFLGCGTACLLWSSPLPGDAGRQLRYVDLMCGRKPNLLVRTVNNLGAETRIEYASSTKFYLADQAAGTPWVTQLPFPVHVVERVETYDYVSRNRFVTRYSYHHGFYDGVEREFRGFGRVDQLDTEELGALTAGGAFPVGDNVSAASNVPPILTKTWFHTGVYLHGGRISRHLAHEYYREGTRPGEGGLSDTQARAMLLPDTVLPPDLTPEEAREACRSLKGAMLRQEIYALDDTAMAGRPYNVTEGNLTIRMLQAQWINRHAVFLTHAREGVTFRYERRLYQVAEGWRADPRVSHELTLDVDDYGNVRTSVTVGYGRRFPDPSPLLSAADRREQARVLLTLTENDYTNAVHQPGAYRTPLPAESRRYELLQVRPDAVQPAVTNFFRFGELRAKARAAGDGRHDVPVQDLDPDWLRPGQPYRRLIERTRTLYRPDDLGTSRGDRTALLPLGTVQSRALVGNAYKLALSAGLIRQAYRRAGTELLPAPATVLGSRRADGGGYADLDGDGNWWVPSGRVYYHAGPDVTPAQELAEARRHFFTPRRFADPFGHAALIDYDPHDLLITRTTDAAGNTAGAVNDYRVLRAAVLSDPNGNRAAVSFDTLGLVAGTAVMGKVTEDVGDSLAGFTADLSARQVDEFFAADDPHTAAAVLLQGATTRIVYDLHRFQRTHAAHPSQSARWEPAYTATLARETHASDPLPPGGLKIQISFSYSDGFSREIQKKVQSDPGPVVEGGPTVDPRWVGTGWTIVNNKGNPVRQYEPFFSQLTARRHRFEFGLKIGVSPILCYDPAGRVVATVHPNHTFEKVIFDPWQQESWDVNDTVLITDPGADPEMGDFLRRLPAAEYLPTWYEQRAGGALGIAQQQAAEKAASHAGTPARAYLDSLGRTVLAIADNGRGRRYATRTVLDIKGNPRTVIDALGRVVMRYNHDLLGTTVYRESMEAGRRWSLSDVTAKRIRDWDSRDYSFRTEYDTLRRPWRSFVQGGDHGGPADEAFATAIMYERTVYGDSAETGLTRAQQEQANLRAKVMRHHDGAGIATTDLYDFKGNSLRSERQFAREYKTVPDWSRSPALEPETFVSTTTYDALSRVVTATTPDQSIYRPGYDEASLLDRIDVSLRGSEEGGEPAWTPFVTGIDYNARGQRTAVRYANHSHTTYTYDEETFRVIRLRTRREAPGNGLARQIFRAAGTVQDLRYTYDPAGNITRIGNEALRTVFHANQRVDPVSDYTYDPLYRLTAATGRENIAQSAFQLAQSGHNYRDYPFVGAAALADLQALRNFTERFDYDPVGNFEKMVHRAGPGDGTWTRRYTYREASLIEPGMSSNRLSLTALHADPAEPVDRYHYDAHGNVTQMPHLPVMRWDFRDQFSASSPAASGADVTYYVYDAAGQRARKVTERPNGTRKAERYYGAGFELYRVFDARGAVALERQTLHVMDAAQRIALVETRTVEDHVPVADPAPVPRYQLSDQLGSATLELGGSGELITYEEYSPYGCTTFEAGRSAAELSLKRYRYTRKERDEENGFTYHGARYYAPWLGRWTSCDPAGLMDRVNLYQYALLNPIGFSDPSGMWVDPNAFIDNPDADPAVIGGGLQFKTEGGKFATIYDEQPTFEDSDKPAPPPKATKKPTPPKSPAKEKPLPPSANTESKPPPAPPAEPPATGQEAAAYFAKGAAEGLATGIAIDVGIGIAAGLTGIAAGTLGLALGAVLLPVAIYGVVTHWDQIKAGAGRLFSGQGTAQDYETAGNVVGGLLSIPAAGAASEVGTELGQGARTAAKDALETLTQNSGPELATAGGGPRVPVPDEPQVSMMEGGESGGGGSESGGKAGRPIVKSPTVTEILRTKRGSITRADLPPGSPSWADISNMTLDEVRAAAQANKTGFRTIYKLLNDRRFNKP